MTELTRFAIMPCLLLLFLATGAHARLRVLTNEEPPTNYMAGDALMGTSVDIVREIMRRTGDAVPIEILPWARSFSISQKMPDVVAFTAGRTEDRVAQGFSFLGPVITRHHAVYKRAGSDVRVFSIEDVKKQELVVGGLRGDWRLGYFKKRGVRVEAVNSHESNLLKLLKGRRPLMISSDIEMRSLLRQLNRSVDEVEVAFVFKEASSYIMFSKGTSPAILRKWQRAFGEMQRTDFFERTATKYHELLELPFQYSTEKGFHLN